MVESMNEEWQKKIKEMTEDQQIIYGRQEPKIYAFSTNTIPNYLKIGDTQRPLYLRMNEWRKYFKDLKEEYSESAMVDDEVFFRDYAVHRYLENDLGKRRIEKEDFPNSYYSNEFFKDTSIDDIKEATGNVRKMYGKNINKYRYIDAESGLKKTEVYPRTVSIKLRKEQKEAVEKFKKAIDKGRTDLLLYAVMRFGKSVVALSCAQEMKDAKVVLIVSAKADVKDEWKRTAEEIVQFDDFAFVDAEGLANDDEVIKKINRDGKKAAIFLTLQDLNGDDVKQKHKELFRSHIDLIIIDETHFGAWADKYGRILKRAETKEDKDVIDSREGVDSEEDYENAEKSIKRLNSDVRLHLSGTPYRLLMEKRFSKDDIIGFYQLSDIVEAKRKWDEEHFKDMENATINKATGHPYNEWDNPYFGLPEMIRFALNPNESARKKLEKLKSSNIDFELSNLFLPQSKVKSDKGLHKKFKYEQEVLNLMMAIDGSKDDENVLGFLNDERIKKGHMCRHVVIVLPLRASCDALEKLIGDHKKNFLNLGEYKIINISGVDKPDNYKTVASVKDEISNCEKRQQKTITLTVNRMLAGVTVKEWDSMIFLKSSNSPQEYDQAIFRIQNQYISGDSRDENGIMVRDMKPQTLLVDFDPMRLFEMQASRSQKYNWYEDKNGNQKLRQRLEDDLRISPIIFFNLDKIHEVKANDLMRYIRNYTKNISISDEVNVLPVDMATYSNPVIKNAIDSQPELSINGSLRGNVRAYEGEDTDMDISSVGEAGAMQKADMDKMPTKAKTEQDKANIESRYRAYYLKILFYAFLSDDNTPDLYTVGKSIEESPRNNHLAQNIGIDKAVIDALSKMDRGYLSQLDYAIQDINELSRDEELHPIERIRMAINKFRRLSNSEIITPSVICEQMIKAALSSSPEGKPVILDIASKVGEFATVAYQCFKERGISDEIIRSSIYSIPTSKMAYEFTKKTYESLGLNTDNIAQQFTTYDIMEIPPENIRKILMQNKKFSDISLNMLDIKEGDKNMKFDIVVGNPPYQDEAIGNNKAFTPQIYWKFINLAYKLAPKAVLIHPARFLFNAGSTPKEWNRKMLSNPHLRVLFFEQASDRVFPNTDIKGGVAITQFDSKQNFGAIEVFTPYPELRTIMEKVSLRESDSLMNIIFVQNRFNLDQLYKEYPQYKTVIGSNGKDKRFRNNIFDKVELFTENKKDGDIKIIGIQNNKRTWRYIPNRFIERKHENLGSWKVILPRANGSGAIGEVLSTPLIGEPLIGYTQSFIGIGSFATRSEAEAALKYIKSKFCRTMLGVLKITQDNNRDAWKLVPLQDFTSNSDIDWSKSISEIDKQLYKKYGLNQKEINFIEEKIKPME